MGLLGGDTMKVAHELPNSATLHHLGSSALYLIATLPEKEKQATKKTNRKGAIKLDHVV